MELWLKGTIVLVALLVFGWALSVERLSLLTSMSQQIGEWPAALVLLIKDQAYRLEGILRDLAFRVRVVSGQADFVAFCVDMGSRDESVAILERLERHYPFIQVINGDSLTTPGDAVNWVLTLAPFESLYVMNLCRPASKEQGHQVGL